MGLTTARLPALRYVIADARRLSEVFPPSNFALALDKGGLDAICSGEGFDHEGALVTNQLAQVVRTGGRWLSISLMPLSVLELFVSDSVWSLRSSTQVSPGVHAHVWERMP